MSSSDNSSGSNVDYDEKVALRIALERSKSEREAKEIAEEKARLAKMKPEQDRAVHRMRGPIVLSYSDSDDGGNNTSSFDPPPAADGYNCASDRKGKGPARKW
ncbi:hypothetical protein D1007_56567 [Hordeum vulgare]|nr:hypothetical protein D1007_56567 [Hordeum vulgare]